MSLSRTPPPRGVVKTAFWDLLTFDRLLTGPVIHLIYWAGLGVIVLVAFFIAGAAVGTALREGDIMGILLGFGVLIAGVLVFAAMVLMWRAFCEFYVAIFRISEDLRALREASTGQPETLRDPGRPLV
jgi:hypothetical protein